MNKNGIIVALLSLALVSCAGTNYKPSTAGVGVRNDINTTRGEIQKTQGNLKQAGQRSDTIGHNLDQADRKNVLIRRYIELWDGK